MLRVAALMHLVAGCALPAFALGTQAPSLPAAPTQPEPQTTPADASLPAAADLFRKHLSAIGGEDALRSHRNRVSRGRASSFPGGEFALVTTWLEPPERLHSRFERPGQAPVDTIFSSGYGWKVLGGNRAELIRNETLRELRDEADFFADVEFDRRFSEMQTIDRVTSPEGGTMYRVRVVYAYGKDELHYFDAETGLRHAVLTSTMRPEGQIPMIVVYKDYRSISGVQIPHEVIITVHPGKENESGTRINFTSIQANVPSVPSWEMPPALAEIVKKLESQSPQTPPPAAG